MKFEASILDQEDDEPTVVVLSGVAASGAARQVASLAEECRSRNVRRVVLDLRRLGSISRQLALEIVSWQRWLMDHDGHLVVVDPNVVVRWILEQNSGATPVEIEPTVEAARNRWDEHAEIPGDVVSPKVPTVSLSLGSLVARPDRSIMDTLESALKHHSDPVGCEALITTALKRAGLAERAVLLLVRHDRMIAVSREDVQVEAGGWFGSMLESANSLMAREEIGTPGLSLNELALLKWTGGDVFLPLIADGVFHGVLALASGRVGGLMGYRSGEVLAIDLMGRWLTRHLAAIGDIESYDVDVGNETVSMSLV